MKTLIVEDEKHAADRLCRLLKKIDNLISVAGITETVEDTINWLQENPAPDFILMDIQLDDGICFEIFETIKVTTPVIFTTAYDEYALKAFKVNSVDYLLKPIEEDALKAAIEKFKTLYLKETGNNELIEKMINSYRKQYKNRFLLKIGTHYKSISVNEISHFFIAERSSFIRTFIGRDFCVEQSLDQLQKLVDPLKFFRINRNYLVNIDAITDMVSYSSSRLLIKLKDEKPNDDLIVSRDKVSEFKRWMDR
jgi:DNA-binding LytR/AlgR family response regulator